MHKTVYSYLLEEFCCSKIKCSFIYTFLVLSPDAQVWQETISVNTPAMFVKMKDFTESSYHKIIAIY